MSLWPDLRYTSRLGLLIAAAAATVGVIYGYDLSNIVGALLFITDQFHLSTFQQELVTTAVFALLGALSVSVIVPVFVAESAPTKVRGALLVAYQAATVVGIIAGYLAAPGCAGRGGPGRLDHACGSTRSRPHTRRPDTWYQADLVALDAHLHVTDVMHHGRWLAPASHPTMQGHAGEHRVPARTTAGVAGPPQPEETSP